MSLARFCCLLFCTLFELTYSVAMATEEVNYIIVDKNEVFEIRKYSDRIAVETIIADQSNSFRKLFSYISGNNKNNKEIKMTTPVTRIEKNGKMTMQFYLPKKFDQNSVPEPTMPDVQIVIIKSGYYAAIRYSGRASEANYTKHKAILQNELKKNKISTISPSIRATYNSPFTLPIFRRNEVMFKIHYN